MRKFLMSCIITLCLVLVACGEESLTKDEVLEQATEASEELESYSADIKIETEADGEKFTVDAVGDITHDPEAAYMDMSIGMPGITMDVEIYMVEEEAFMKMFGEWIILGDEEFDLGEFDELNEEEIDKLDPFIDQLEMTEEEDQYVFTLSEEEGDFLELIDTYLELSTENAEMDQDWEENLDGDLIFNSIELEMTIDKETMLIDTHTLQADFEVDGEAYTIDVEMGVSKADEIEPIELPEGAKENAVRTDGFDLGYEEEFDDGFDEELDYIDIPMPIEEIEEMVDYQLPEITNVPDGYELMESYYYEDVFMEMVYLIYQRDIDDGFIYTVYPEYYGEIYEGFGPEEVSVNGNEGIIEELDFGMLCLTWEHDDVFLELLGEGPEMTDELLLEIAESVE